MPGKVIAIDVREAQGQGAGKGRYTQEITKALIQMAPPDVHFVLFGKTLHPGLPNTGRVRQILLPGKGPFWHLNVIRHLKKNPVDFYFSPTSFIVPALAPKKLRCIPVVHDTIAWHAAKDHRFFPTLVERLTLKRAIQKAFALVTVSDHTKKDLLELFPEAKNKSICVATPAVGKEFYPDKTNHLSLPAHYLLAVGTLLPRKNHIRMLQAFSKLALQHPDLHFVIAGGGHMPESIPERVHFLGYVQEAALRELYSRAECLLFPSLYEGFGIPALEAMACGCPVIASNTSSLPEVTGDAALLIDPTQVDKMVTAVHTILEPETRSIFTKKGLEHVKTFAWEKSAKKILDELLGG